jgi:transposase
MAIELAWGGGRDQPPRAGSPWYRHRCGHGNSRLRRLGMVAVARKRLGQLGPSLQTGARPEGAETSSGRVQMTGRRRGPVRL